MNRSSLPGAGRLVMVDVALFQLVELVVLGGLHVHLVVVGLGNRAERGYCQPKMLPNRLRR